LVVADRAERHGTARIDAPLECPSEPDRFEPEEAGFHVGDVEDELDLRHVHAFPPTSSAARSASEVITRLVLERGTVGMTDASTMRRPSTPLTRSSGSTTQYSSPQSPIAHVPTPW